MAGESVEALAQRIQNAIASSTETTEIEECPLKPQERCLVAEFPSFQCNQCRTLKEMIISLPSCKENPWLIDVLIEGAWEKVAGDLIEKILDQISNSINIIDLLRDEVEKASSSDQPRTEAQKKLLALLVTILSILEDCDEGNWLQVLLFQAFAPEIGQAIELTTGTDIAQILKLSS